MSVTEGVAVVGKVNCASWLGWLTGPLGGFPKGSQAPAIQRGEVDAKQVKLSIRGCPEVSILISSASHLCTFPDVGP